MRLLDIAADRRHALSRMDARIKLILSGLLLVMLLINQGIAFPIIIGLACLAACLMLGMGIRLLLIRFSEPAFLAGVVILLKLFFSGSDQLFSFWFAGVKITGYGDGLIEGISIAVRMMACVSVVSLLSFTTPFMELLAGLSWLKVPRGFIDILIFAYKSLFTLFEDAMVIYQSQKNRLGYRSIGRGLSSFGVLAGSLAIRAFEQSERMVIAMRQRGYDGDIPISRHGTIKKSDLLWSIFFVSILSFIWSSLWNI